MNQKPKTERTTSSLEENLKKALTELLVLHLLSVREHYIGELSSQISALSNRSLSVVFPYAAIYRMARAGYIQEMPKRIAPDGRLRQYYQITLSGREYLASMKTNYAAFSHGVMQILAWEGDEP